ncbi:MAG TPA: phosphocarrier protein HPr [Elusimicrobia bacterium]|nr:phosphocarrier protein HPr [Elusimicrobiota bacterium]HBT61863.1 phosphocarrier protein HPr [Elusimicrobiota bacterium]
MIKKILRVTPRLGLHAKPAGMFVREAGRFKSEIMVCKEGAEVNGKSVMQLMLLAAEYGAQVTLRVTGPDEQEALAAIEELFRRKFDEE